MRKPNPRKPGTTTVTARIPIATMDRIRSIAIAEDRPFANVAARLLKAGLEAIDAQSQPGA